LIFISAILIVLNEPANFAASARRGQAELKIKTRRWLFPIVSLGCVEPLVLLALILLDRSARVKLLTTPPGA
jgi:hypothetical protein